MTTRRAHYGAPTRLRPHRLSSEGGAFALQDLSRAEPLGQLLNLDRGTHVDPVEDRWPERPIGIITEEEGWPYATDAHRDDRVAPGPVDEFLTQRDHVLPPDQFGVDLGPPGRGIDIKFG